MARVLPLFEWKATLLVILGQPLPGRRRTLQASNLVLCARVSPTNFGEVVSSSTYTTATASTAVAFARAGTAASTGTHGDTVACFVGGREKRCY